MVPDPDSFMLRPVSSGRADPWLLPDSMPVCERSLTAPVAEPESSFFEDFESIVPPR
jgi:hypothetical protein